MNRSRWDDPPNSLGFLLFSLRVTASIRKRDREELRGTAWHFADKTVPWEEGAGAPSTTLTLVAPQTYHETRRASSSFRRTAPKKNNYRESSRYQPKHMILIPVYNRSNDSGKISSGSSNFCRRGNARYWHAHPAVVFPFVRRLYRINQKVSIDEPTKFFKNFDSPPQLIPNHRRINFSQ